MRCQSCNTENAEGHAICTECGAPLTGYAEGISGRVRGATRARVARETRRPPIVPVVAALGAVWAIAFLWSFVHGEWAGAASALATTDLADEEIRDANRQGITGLTAVARMLGAAPVPLALAGVVWGAWNQHAWAWYAVLTADALNLWQAANGFAASPFLSILRACAGIAVAVAWTRHDVRRWFGVA